MMGVSVVTLLAAHPKKALTGDDIAVYNTGVDSPSSIRAVKLEGVTGELVRQWDFVFDGGTVLNVDNTPISVKELYDNFATFNTEDLLVTMLDNTGSVWRDETETVTVKIEKIELSRMSTQGDQSFAVTVKEVV